jgi:predicted kinase
VHCNAPQTVLRERIAARTAARNYASEAGLEVLARQPGYWEPFEADEVARVAAVDTSDPAAVAALLDRLATPAAG